MQCSGGSNSTHSCSVAVVNFLTDDHDFQRQKKKNQVGFLLQDNDGVLRLQSFQTLSISKR